jgi:hypothetical protein
MHPASQLVNWAAEEREREREQKRERERKMFVISFESLLLLCRGKNSGCGHGPTNCSLIWHIVIFLFFGPVIISSGGRAHLK